jgi:NDP-sugar pyrophosphorylase family protein
MILTKYRIIEFIIVLCVSYNLQLIIYRKQMKIILLATAQTKSCYPLTFNKPNALLKVYGKTLLEHALESASPHCRDIRVVISKNHLPLFGNAGLGNKIKYEVIEHHSQLNDIIFDNDKILDSAFYFPKSDSLQGLMDGMFKIKYSWDLLSCQEKYTVNSGIINEGQVETGAVVSGHIRIGNGTVIRSGACIEGHVTIGENCTIGPNCYIRGVCAIGSNCRIGNAVEIKNSILGDDVNACHLSYVGDSIIGDGANLGAGFISSNLRHDGTLIVTRLNGEKVDTKRQKLGAIIGDGVHTGINTSTYPGRKIWPGIATLPGTIVTRDIEA